MENNKFSFPGITFPITGSVAVEPGVDLSPVLYRIADFLPRVIETHLGDRWRAETAGLGLSSSGPVQQVLPYNPWPMSKTSVWRFPLLAVYKTVSTYERDTYGFYRIRKTYEVAYVHYPWSPAESERLLPFIEGAERVIINRLIDGSDPTWRDGESLLLPGTSLTVLGSNSDKWTGDPGSDINFPGITIRFYIDEILQPSPSSNFVPYGGIDASIDIASGSADGGNITGPYLDFIKVRT